jgi:hypothetical protein
MLWSFLQRAVAGTIAAAIRATHCHLCPRTLQRIWQRFQLGQSHIRNALYSHGRPPDPPPEHKRQTESQVLAHLQAAFPNHNGSIAKMGLRNCGVTSFS